MLTKMSLMHQRSECESVGSLFQLGKGPSRVDGSFAALVWSVLGQADGGGRCAGSYGGYCSLDKPGAF